MVWKSKEAKKWYDKGYYQGYKRATIDHLGGRCKTCKTRKRLQIHHTNGLCRQRRSVTDLKDLSVLEVYCKKHHDEVDRE